MAIAFSNLGVNANPDINSTANASSYATSSWAPPSSGLIFVFVFHSGSTNPQPTITGNSITWTAVGTNTFGTYRITLFGANASGSSTGATTVDFAGNSQDVCNASFGAASGVDLSGGVAAAFVQVPGNQGSFGTTLTVTLASAGGSDNRPISGFGWSANEGGTPRANWTELDDFSNSDGLALETQYREDAFETTASCTVASSTNWRALAAELKASAGGAATVLDPFGMSGFFGS